MTVVVGGIGGDFGIEPDADDASVTALIPQDITIVGNGGVLSSGAAPLAPTLVSVFEANDSAGDTIVCAGVVANAATGSFPVAQYRLVRAPSAAGPWTTVDQRPLSVRAVETILFDSSPPLGIGVVYAAMAVDAAGGVSPASALYRFVPFVPHAEPAPVIADAARGPYPHLGQDVFIHPATGEAVIGPNGDLLTVNGLACLAQDLRLRLLTSVGEVSLHPAYGFNKGKSIGAGQASKEVQAQILRTDIMDALRAEPRVANVLAVEIDQYDATSWLVAYTVSAIGVEDPQRMNLVYPYFEVPA